MAISIAAVVPCFNGARFVQSALDSVLAQSLPVKDIVFVDDGSTDGSVEQAEQWWRRHPGAPLKILSQQNRGVSVARNEGWQATAAEWVALLDVDDVWYEDHNVALQAVALSVPDCVLAFCDIERRTEQPGKLLATVLMHAGLADEMRSIVGPWTLVSGSRWHRKLLTGSFIPTSSTLIRREALVRTGGFEPGRKYGEDRQMWLRLMTDGTIAASASVCGQKILHDTNVTHRSNALELLRGQIDLVSYLQAHPSLYGLGQDELAVLKDEHRALLKRLQYATSSRGLRHMLRARSWNADGQAVQYSAKDWLRGAWRELSRRSN